MFCTLGFEPGKMPGRMDMIKLMMDKEFRDAAQKVGELEQTMLVGRS